MNQYTHQRTHTTHVHTRMHTTCVHVHHIRLFSLPYEQHKETDGEHGAAGMEESELPDLEVNDNSDPAARSLRQQAQLAAARKEAERLLVHPEWRQWAEDMLHQCEDGFLTDVAKLFPEEEKYVSRETYRYQRLRSMYPGASFATELLLENAREPLDLSKVTISRHILHARNSHLVA